MFNQLINIYQLSLTSFNREEESQKRLLLSGARAVLPLATESLVNGSIKNHDEWWLMRVAKKGELLIKHGEQIMKGAND